MWGLRIKMNFLPKFETIIFFYDFDSPLQKLLQDITDEYQCEMLERCWIFFGWVSLHSLLWKCWIFSFSNLFLYMFSYLLFLFLQKRHHSELHHEDLLWKPCFSTGTAHWNLCSFAFAVFISWPVRCRELKRIWIKTALVSLTIQNWYFLLKPPV